MTWTHWSVTPLTEIRPTKQTQARFDKPSGLWLSDESQEDCWSSWCRDNAYEWLTDNKYEVKLVEAPNLLRLSSKQELLDFTKNYALTRGPSSMCDMIDWVRVAKEYGGIAITPYVWECRLSLHWYYSWDVASACIWDPTLIESFGKA